MKDNEFSELSERFLLMQKENIFISDKDTYEVLFADESLKKIFGADIVGKKCFSAFAGKNEPCRNCISADCDETVQSWEIHRMYGDKKYMYLVRGMISAVIRSATDGYIRIYYACRRCRYLYFRPVHERNAGKSGRLTGLDNETSIFRAVTTNIRAKILRVLFDVNNLKPKHTYGHETGATLNAWLPR